MGFFGKLFTAVRGAATEAGEAVVDTQAIRILDQEIRDAKTNLDAAKEGLAKVMAEQMGVEREVNKYKKSIAEYEGYAVQALNKNDETLATQIAEKIAELENEAAAQQTVLDGYNNNIANLKQTIRNTERHIQTLEREVSVVKTTEKVQEASSVASAKFSGTNSSLQSATESLERIKQKQQQRSDQMQAALNMQQETSGDELKNKLKDAGILPAEGVSKNSVLERLKAKQAGGSTTASSTTPPPVPSFDAEGKSVVINVTTK